MPKMNVFNCLATALITVILAADSHSAEITLRPVNDVFIRTFGGGEGYVTFLKFDISSVPPGRTIDSVILRGYIWNIGTGWDGDVKFFNVNSQTWQENDSSRIILAIPVSDSTHQGSGFGTAVGWTRSTDLKAIVNRDYNASRTFTSFKLKDPDDRTSVPPPGAMPYDCIDTLALGNRLGTAYVYFYPHEYTADTSRIVRLTVFYPGTGISGQKPKVSVGRIKFKPNPFRIKTWVSFCIEPGDESIALRIYDAGGNVVRELNVSPPPTGSSSMVWSGDDQAGRPLPAGVYFYRITVGREQYRGKVLKGQ